VRRELAELDWPLGEGLIHGDAWAGNLLWDTATTPPRAVVCDWDRVSWGPREIDLIPTWHAAVRYGRDEAWIQDFIKHYGYDLRDWAGYPTLLAMRDLAQLPGLCAAPRTRPTRRLCGKGSAPSAPATAPQPGSLCKTHRDPAARKSG
jgi:aminoglycoside phosphotransferase (APT) family kinase protein